jgi:hypothetical protein
MGGLNSNDNLVALTPEEHLVAHLLLAKIFPENGKLLYAANMMGNRCNKRYGWLRRKVAGQIKIDRIGFRHSDESRRKMSQARSGVPKSSSWKESRSQSCTTIIEYKGSSYYGWEDLKQKTGVSKHLYKKYYEKGVDPALLINNRSVYKNPFVSDEIKSAISKSRSQKIAGRTWFNDGVVEKLFLSGEEPELFKQGRLGRKA